jgi:hypothetical protein
MAAADLLREDFKGEGRGHLERERGFNELAATA